RRYASTRRQLRHAPLAATPHGAGFVRPEIPSAQGRGENRCLRTRILCGHICTGNGAALLLPASATGLLSPTRHRRFGKYDNCDTVRRACRDCDSTSRAGTTPAACRPGTLLSYTFSSGE